MLSCCSPQRLTGVLALVNAAGDSCDCLLAFPFFRWQLFLTQRSHISKLTSMEVHLKPETESCLNELASRSGLPTDDLMEDALAGYLQEVAEVRQMLDGRYDEVKSGRVKPVDGEAFFESLRQREDELLKNRSSK